MKYFLSTLITASLAFVSLSPSPVLAQGAEAARTIEEIIVTGRKRDENMTDVPVSISVITAESLAEQGILSPQDLFDATVGLTYDETFNGRNFTNPGVRGVQSELVPANLQKVNNFIDGMPMQGNAGSLSTFGLDLIEVYRGPQSAAFGRSTFVGAINYVTADAAEEFNGRVQTRFSDQGDAEVSATFTGPLGDRLGYVASFLTTEWGGPDEWTSTDGFEMGSNKTDQFMGKLNFEFSDRTYGEIMYTRHHTDDNPAGGFAMNPATCPGESGIFRNSRGVDVELQSGDWDCDPSIPAGGVPRNHDILGQFLAQYDANIGAYTAKAATAMGPGSLTALDTNTDGLLQSSEWLAQTFTDGQTYEQTLRGQSVADPFTRIERDRIQGELNIEFGDSLLQFMAMYNDETLDVWQDRSSDSLAVIALDPRSMRASLGRNVGTQFIIESDKEQYGEVRWVSPAEDRLRYTLSGSYYEYEFNGQSYTNGGAIFYGLTLPGGAPINPKPRTNISENATNLGASLSLQYDLNDRVTLSLESRYQVDEVCGLDLNGPGIEFCTETKAFLPRLAASWTVSENHTTYAQYSVGNNPAGVTVGYQDPAIIEALQVASGKIPHDGITYDGSDGVHFPSVAYDATTYAAYDEEKLYNFEIGSKGTFAQGRGSYASAIYFMEWRDMLGSQSLDWEDDTVDGWNESGWSDATGLRTWINRGDGEFYGVELTADYALGELWMVGGYLTYSQSKYKEFCSIDVLEYRDAPGGARGMGKLFAPILSPKTGDKVLTDCGVVNGNDIPRQSDITGNLNLSLTLPNNVFGLRTSLRADVRYTGPYFADDLNFEERSALTTLNLSANLRNENWTVRLYVNNVTDEDEPTNLRVGSYYTDNANPTMAPSSVGGWLIYPRRPRESGLQLSYHF